MGQSSSNASTPRGNTVGDWVYYDSDRLGKGAFGSVYKATNSRTGMTAAVKVVINNTGADFREAQREADNLARIDSAHVVSYYGCYADKSAGKVFIITQLCEGSLSELVSGWGKFNEINALRAANHLMMGYYAIHKNGILHRDIKPANILYSRGGNGYYLKIADFGLAKMAFAIHRNNSVQDTYIQGTLLGTPNYMAPELHYEWYTRGASQTQYDSRIDMWSVGLVLIYCCTGKEPIKGDVFQKVVQSGPIAGKGMCKNTDDCYKSLQDLLEELTRFNYHERMKANEFTSHPATEKFKDAIC